MRFTRTIRTCTLIDGGSRGRPVVVTLSDVRKYTLLKGSDFLDIKVFEHSIHRLLNAMLNSIFVFHFSNNTMSVGHDLWLATKCPTVLIQKVSRGLPVVCYDFALVDCPI